MTAFVTYIVECADGTFYTGIATDLDRRIREHNGGDDVATSVKLGKGARYTSSRRPVTLVYSQLFATRSDALKEEARIKRLSRAAKAALVGRIGRGP